MEQWLRDYPPLRKDLVEKILAEKSPQRPKPQPALKLEQLDLHGYTGGEAEAAMRRVIDRLPEDRSAILPVLHGKGLHSKDGRAVLPQVVAKFALDHPRVQQCQHPPEPQGGRGVTILYISTVSRRK